MKKNKTTILLFIFLSPEFIISQTRVSISTDASVQRSFKKEQRFWAFGQDVVINGQFTPKTGIYACLSYYSNGNFRNPVSATAKSATTLPQEVFFTNRAQLRLVQISLGWKHYLAGRNDAELSWNLYCMAGFGLLMGKAANIYSIPIDTSLYNPPQQPVNGVGHFKRLTFDLGLGWDVPLGGDIYFYSEGKIWIPTTEYPSKYLLVNNNAPLAAMVSAGLRILF